VRSPSIKEIESKNLKLIKNTNHDYSRIDSAILPLNFT
jgi:hypothetical protein